MQRTLRQIVRLNKTLLLLTKIDNGQFPESSEVDLAAVVGEQIDLYDEIYAGRGIACTVSAPEAFVVRMNESLASPESVVSVMTAVRFSVIEVFSE